ncbi:MAG: hypothetical protein OEM18_03060 [Nitrosopumilus sp.]|nr:hypothetical protein [Nitrosopumilus sp.]MDH3502017.1 hypothetical protein [Nitrosopumilus sp.]
MKINFERSGGFAGITNSCIINSDKLSLDEQKHLQELLNDLRSSKTKDLPLSSEGRDCFQYKILVEDGEKFTIMTDELTMDSKQRNLIDFLETRLE